VRPLHLVARQLGEAQVDAPHVLVELIEEQRAGHTVGLVERGVVDGIDTAPQRLPGTAAALLGGGGQIVGPVVVAVVAEERGEEGAGLEGGLPVLVTEGAEVVAGGHGAIMARERTLRGERGRGVARRACRCRIGISRWDGGPRAGASWSVARGGRRRSAPA